MNKHLFFGIFKDTNGFGGIIAYNVMFTPGLVLDEKVVAAGRIPSKAEITSMIATVLSESEM